LTRVVAVVGGGTSGLAAARVLAGAAAVSAGCEQSREHQKTAPDLEVRVLESEDHFGGKVLSGEFRGRSIDFGPDNFLTRNPSAADMSDELGLGGALIAPATSSAWVVSRGRLHPMPGGLILGLPPNLMALASSRIVSARGLARASLDLLGLRRPMTAADLGLPAAGTADGPEWSAGSLLRYRLGRELVERLVDPLLGGINAGSTDQLSLAVVAPQVAQALLGHRSVTRALGQLARRSRKGPATGGVKPRPFFLGMTGGLGRIVSALVADLESRGVELETGTGVTALRRIGDRYELDTPDGTIVADAVVLATPGHTSARLLVDDAPAAAAELGSIPHSSVALVTLAWIKDEIPPLPAGSGFLAPRCEGQLVTGCTFLSAKWPGTAQEGEVVLRVSTGRYGDERPSALSDEELVDRVLDELKELVGISNPPLESLVQRWPRAFPQYLPGHVRKIERTRAALAELPGLKLAGPCLGGIGIPACLTTGERAAVDILNWLGE
jgi:oxygen-dependent protoporphyrinogen oxidase